MMAGGPGSGCHGPNCGRPPGRVAQVPRSDFPLTKPQRLMETRARASFARNPEGLKAAYRARFGNELNADNAKELFADYARNRTEGAAAVHESASEMMKQIYKEELAKPAPAGKQNMVFFTAGGAGAGKTTAIKGDPDVQSAMNQAQIVFDGTLRPAASAIKKIDQALAAGKSAHIVFVDRDPVEAFRQGVLGRADRQEKATGSGRTVMLDEFAAQHSSVLDSMRAIDHKYANDPRVKLEVLSNRHGAGSGAQSVRLDSLPDQMSKDELRATLLPVLEEAKRTGAISSTIYRATKGSGVGKEIGM